MKNIITSSNQDVESAVFIQREYSTSSSKFSFSLNLDKILGLKGIKECIYSVIFDNLLCRYFLSTDNAMIRNEYSWCDVESKDVNTLCTSLLTPFIEVSIYHFSCSFFVDFRLSGCFQNYLIRNSLLFDLDCLLSQYKINHGIASNTLQTSIYDSDNKLKIIDEKTNVENFNQSDTIISVPSDQLNRCLNIRINYLLDDKLNEKLREFCAKKTITVQDFFQAVIYVYVYKTKHVKNITLDTIVYGDVELKEINTIYTRLHTAITLDPNAELKQLFTQILDSKNNLGLDNIDKFETEDILYTYSESIFDENILDNLNVLYPDNKSLKIHVQNNDSISLNLECSDSFYDTERVSNIVDSLVSISETLIENGDSSVDKTFILGTKEYNKVVYEFNDTYTDYPRDKSIISIFHDCVTKYGKCTALEHTNSYYSYEQLNERANQLAHTLIDCGYTPGLSIGVLVDRSAEFIIAILGILKVGCSYVPLDIKAPKDRLVSIIKDCSIPVVLTNNQFECKLSNEIKSVSYDDWFISDNVNNPNIQTSAEHLAYVMYTSGSTGKPKGVMVADRNVVRLVKNNNFIDYSKRISILLTGSLVFDAITFEIWLALLNGGTLCIPDDRELLSSSLLHKKIKEQNINTLFLTTSLFNYITNQNIDLFSSVDHILTGGDVLSVKHVNQIKKKFPNIRLSNCYGPTENGCMSTVYTVNGFVTNSVPIGSPISNSSVYILDENQKPVSIGVTGEIYVGGDGVAKGYLNDSVETDSKFINNPFVSGVMYKTGDLGKWTSDGNVIFLGRVDNQIKIRGFRIEIEEIESVALSHKEISQVYIIVLKGNDGNKELSLYYTSNELLNSDELKSYLQNKLPPYMVPFYITRLDKFPINANGKVDTNRLISSTSKKEPSETVAIPKTDLEQTIEKIWCEIFNLNYVDLNISFFSLGGHSLRAMQMIDLIKANCNVELDISDVFNHPTIRQIAAKVETVSSKKMFHIPKLENSSYYKMSFAQRRLFLLNQIDGNTINYNVPIVFKLGKDVNLIKLYRALKKLIKRHDALKTTFELRDDEAVQIIHSAIDLEIERFSEHEQEVEHILEDFIKPFDLNQLPLFRIGIIASKDDENIVVFDFHHIIGDGESLKILLRDFNTFYNGKNPNELRIQYKDYASWLFEYSKGDNYLKQEAYWLNKLSGDLPILNLPYDRPRPKKQEFYGDEYIFEIDNHLVKKLNVITQATNTTLYMLLISAYSILLSKYSRQRDILIGTPICGRSHSDANNLVGIFINNIVIRCNTDSELPFDEFLLAVKKTVLEAFENQDYQFEDLVSRLKLPKDLSRTPIFDTVFVVQDVLTKDIHFDNIETLPFDFRNKSAKYDLFFEAYPVNDQIKFVINYSTSLFNTETIEAMSVHFMNILEVISNNMKSLIKDIDLLSDIEQKCLIENINATTLSIDKDDIVSLFKERVHMSSNDIALVFKNKEITYKQLDIFSDNLANTLLNNNIAQHSLVGIMVRRSELMFIAQLAVLKAGCAYLPIDNEFPKNRIEYIVEKGNVKHILTETDLADSFEFFGNKILIDNINLDNPNGVLRSVDIKPEDIAYTIFTSGSTGDPKGVQISHKAVVNFIRGITNTIDFDSNKSILCLTTISFDIYVLESLLALCNGNKVVIADEEQQLNSVLLNQFIIDSEIELLQITPSRLQLLLAEPLSHKSLETIKVIMIGGEAFPKHLLKQLKSFPNLKIYNMYGPTETTVWSTVKDMTDSGEITLGKPIANTQIYVLDENLKIVPVGVIGELYIGGFGLSTGYYQNEKLTNARFIANPFGKDLIYKTGDLVKLNKAGELEFCGRADFQVKVRGYRIELDEVEERMRACNGVDEVVVIVEEGKSGYNQLIGYYTSDIEHLENKTIREQLAKELPSYMIPDILVRIDAIPLTPNNKVDRKQLPKADLFADRNVSIETIMPHNKVEEQILQIWRDVINNNNISIYDSFFEVGGNSLSLVIMTSRLNSLFPGIVRVTDVFTYPTIAKLAEFIEQINNSSSKNKKNINTIEIPEVYIKNKNLKKYSRYSLSYSLNVDLQNKLQILSNSWHVDSDIVLTSIYAYVLNKIVRNKSIVFYLLRENELFELKIDLTNISKLEDIIISISKELDKESFIDLNNPEALQTIVRKEYNSTISILFAYKDSHIDKLVDFDIQLRFSEYGIEKYVNIDRLALTEWEHFFENYTNIINQVLKQVI